MSPSEEYFLKVRNKLDDLGYLQPMSFESAVLVDKLLEDMLETKQQLQHYKNVAHQSMEACSELQMGVGPYKEDNAKLVRENNQLRQKLLHAREAIEESKVELRRDIRKLEKERTLQDYLCSQHAAKISHLQAELAQKTTKLLEFKGIKGKFPSSGLQKKKGDTRGGREHALDRAQDRVNHLTQEVTRLQCEQQQLDDVIESLKNKVNARDGEIERLTGLLTDGRPLMSRDQCESLDCGLLAKHNQLCQQLQESKQKQHEAMVRAVELAERNQMLQRNQLLEERRLPSARSDGKKCCCAENADKICSLQEKLEDRILRVERLELELAELKKTNSEMKSDKLSLDKILEITLEEKKKMNDRINELTIIEHDLMLELDRLRRTNAMQRSQLAELEARVVSPPPGGLLRPQAKSAPAAKPTSTGMSAAPKPEPKRPALVKRVTLQAVPAPPPARKPTCPRPAVKRASARPPLAQPPPASEPTTSPSPSPSPSPPPDWHEQLIRERKRFEAELQAVARQQEEHCAKFHPPPCPQAKAQAPAPAPAPASDAQWLLLERVQAERDYYHKEFTRLRDQLTNIPDHSNAASGGSASPLQKLERLLSERDYYHKEMCRLLEAMQTTQSARETSKAVSELEELVAMKQDEINILLGKLADLQHRLAAPEVSGEVMKRINAKEQDIKFLSEKIKDLEQQMSSSNTQSGEELKRRLNLKEEEILNLRDRLKHAEKSQIPPEHQQQTVAELWRKLNLKEEEILNLREKLRDMERNQVPIDITQTNSELWRRLNLKEDELSRMQDKLRSTEQNSSEYLSLKRKFNQKEEENLCLREQIREYECNRCSTNNGVNQALVSRLELERDTAKADCVRLREENNALRSDVQRVKDGQQEHISQMKQDYERCIGQWEVERRSLSGEATRLHEELRLFKDRLRELQAETSDLRTRANHHKMIVEQNERELRTTQDQLSQSEAELASALDRIGQLTDDTQGLQWQLKELRQERACLKANLARLDQEKDTLLLKVDEKTEQMVRVEAELEARDSRVASLEAFIADLQKKLELTNNMNQ